MSDNKQGKLEGALGQVQNLGQLIKLLEPHFASSSLFQAPGVTDATQTGNRTVAYTNRSGNAPKPTDGAVLSMVGGTVNWYFSTPFTQLPSVTATPYGAHGGATLYISAIGKDHVTITSTDNTDTRPVHISAIQTPSGAGP